MPLMFRHTGMATECPSDSYCTDERIYKIAALDYAI